MNTLASEKIKVVPALDGQALDSDATVDGTTIDRVGSGGAKFQDAMVYIDVGLWTDGTHTFTLEDSPDDSTWTAVAAGLFSGTAVVSSLATDNTQYVIEYLGGERYVRVTVTSASVTSGLADVLAVGVLADPDRMPVA